MATEEIPNYNDVQLDEDIEPDGDMREITKHVDFLKNQKRADLQQQLGQLDEESIDLPDNYDVAGHKYDIEPDRVNPWDGRHVVNSNTLRKDNLRRILVIDSNRNWSSMPQFSNLADGNELVYTAEMQMSRGNEERGGFDRRMQRSVLKREDVDLNQSQTLNNLSNSARRGILGFLRRKK